MHAIVTIVSCVFLVLDIRLASVKSYMHGRDEDISLALDGAGKRGSHYHIHSPSCVLSVLGWGILRDMESGRRL